MTKTKPHGARYPWDTWFAAGRFRLRRGRDYAGATHGMAQTVRQAAARHGLSVSITYAPGYEGLVCAVTRRGAKHA